MACKPSAPACCQLSTHQDNPALYGYFSLGRVTPATKGLKGPDLLQPQNAHCSELLVWLLVCFERKPCTMRPISTTRLDLLVGFLAFAQNAVLVSLDRSDQPSGCLKCRHSAWSAHSNSQALATAPPKPRKPTTAPARDAPSATSAGCISRTNPETRSELTCHSRCQPIRDNSCSTGPRQQLWHDARAWLPGHSRPWCHPTFLEESRCLPAAAAAGCSPRHARTRPRRLLRL